jgi:hypothetical protein
MQDEFSGYVAPCLTGLTAAPAGYWQGEVQPAPTVEWPIRRPRSIYRNGIILPVELIPTPEQLAHLTTISEEAHGNG